MNTVVIYKSRYGAAKKYAQWIAEELNCDIFENKNLDIKNILRYDTIICGGGLYAEMIAGIGFIKRNREKLKDKNIIIFSTGLTPPDCKEYYEKMVPLKNFGKDGVPSNIKLFHFSGKMIEEELSLPHKTAIKSLKGIMSKKANPSDMEKLLIKLCDSFGDFTNRGEIIPLIDYVRNMDLL